MAHITLECPVCEEPFDLEVNYTPGRPAHISAYPENDYPAEGAEVELKDEVSKACPACDATWTPQQLDELQIEADNKVDEFVPEREEYSGPDTLDEDDR